MALTCLFGVLALPAHASAEVPDDFLWGVATSGFQSEGSSPDSNWSRYSDSGRTHDKIGDSVDFRHRYAEDIDRAADLGSKVNGVQLVDGKWTGAADPRSEGTAVSVDAKGKQKLIDGDRAKDGAPAASVG